MPAPSCSTQLAPAVTGIKTVMSVINFLEVYAAYCLMFYNISPPTWKYIIICMFPARNLQNVCY
jgi:hypothetical protein